jgi:hypothetical protein
VAKIELGHAGYETSFKIITVTLDLIEINVTTIGFEDSIDVIRGENIVIEIWLKELGSYINIEGANVTFSWEYGIGILNEKDGGIYELNILIPDSLKGNYKIDIYILKESSYYKAKQFSFFISVKDEQEVISPFLILVIIIILSSVIGALLALFVKSQILIPKKRKKDLELLERIQIFKDVWNIQAILIMERKSGLPIFSKDLSIFKEQDDFLISGFIQAITVFSEDIIESEPSITIEREEVNNFFENIIELDFKHFNFLICDFKSLRCILITKDKCSERLKKQFNLLAVAINSEFSDLLDNYKGPSKEIDIKTELFIKQFLFLHYNQPFKLTEDEIYFVKVMKSGSLTTLEKRIVNVILSVVKTKNEFDLKSIIDLIHEENKDSILDGLRSLLQLKIILPSPYPPI